MMDKFIKLGEYFGYPKCCVKWFIDRLKGKVPFETDSNQNKVEEFKGFIPCPICAEKLVLENKSLSSLIQNRICKTNYPDNGNQLDIENYLQNENK